MDSRKFGLADAMLLVGAVAIGLWVNRTDLRNISLYWRLDEYYRIQVTLQAILPHAAIGSAALLGMRLRRPRPPLRRLARQPGAVACLAASTALLVIAGWIATTMATGRIAQFEVSVDSWPFRGGHGRSHPITHPGGLLLVAYGDRVGFAVAGAWLTLLVSGRWRSEPTWIDRLGRALGCFWLALPVVVWGRAFLL